MGPVDAAGALRGHTGGYSTAGRKTSQLACCPCTTRSQLQTSVIIDFGVFYEPVVDVWK